MIKVLRFEPSAAGAAAVARAFTIAGLVAVTATFGDADTELTGTGWTGALIDTAV